MVKIIRRDGTVEDKGESLSEFKSRMKKKVAKERAERKTPYQKKKEAEEKAKLKQEPPSKYYSKVTTASGEEVYRHTTTNKDAGKTIVKEVYAYAKPTATEGLYESGRSYTIQPQSSQPTTVPKTDETDAVVGVYDTEKQQTSRASQYESMIISSKLDDASRMSSVNQQPSYRPSLKDNKYVYFRQQSGQTQYYSISNKLISEKKTEPDSRNLVWERADTSLKSRIKSKVSAYKTAFSEGFSLRSGGEYYKSELSSGGESLSYGIGVSARIATFTPTWLSGVGAKVGSTVYKYAPNVAQGVTTFTKSLNTPVGKYVQYGGLTLYGGFRSVDYAQAYKQEGTVGISREGFKDVSIFTGVTSAFKGVGTGIQTQAAKDYYVMSGSARAATVAGRNTFTTTVKSSGRIYEFGETGKLSRTFTYDDTATAIGKSKDIVNVRMTPTGQNEIVRTGQYIEAGYRSDTQISLNRVRSLRKEPVVSKSYQSYSTSSDVFGVQVAESQRITTVNLGKGDIEIGRGTSQFKYGEVKNVFADDINYKLMSQETDIGIGGARYSYAVKGQETTLKGKIVTSSKRVTSGIDFSEVIIKEPKSPVYDLTGTSGGQRSQLISEQSTQNVISNIRQQTQNTQFNVMSAAKPPKTESPSRMNVFGLPPDVKIKQVGKVETAPAPKYMSASTSIKRIETPSYKTFGVSVARADTKNRTDTRLSSGNRAVQNNILNQNRNIIVSPPISNNIGAVVPRLRQQQRQAVTQRQRTKQISIYSPRPTSQTSNIYTPFNPELSPPTPILFPKYESKKSSIPKGLSGDINFKSGYTPSLEAKLFEIRGKRPKGYQSGLIVRPL